jgi:predicted nucleic acid-binding protein
VIVVDTQLVAYATLEGPHAALADKVTRRDPNWIAPPILRSEYTNVLFGEMRRGSISLEQANRLVERFKALVAVQPAPEVEAVLALGAASRCTAYDLEFVALAQGAGIQLVTNDRQILDSFPGIAVSLESFAGGSA